MMPRPTRLSEEEVIAWLAQHSTWSRTKDARGNDAILKEFRLRDFADALALVTRIGLHAERMDHHPDLTLSWGKVMCLWSTHDVAGLSDLDLKLAHLCDEAYGNFAKA
jgi:4a-hydroxytetrahydrobiopterin dehydratase